MSETRVRRAPKRQLGQFFTPPAVAKALVESLALGEDSAVLEPSAGDGAFVLPLIERFMALHDGSAAERLAKTLTRNVFACELDAQAHARCLERVVEAYGALPTAHNLVCADFFRHALDAWPTFDVVVGNPPFGATLNPSLQSALDRAYGRRDGFKIKKESYSFFIVRCVERLAEGGRLRFICSDTFLTIPTMMGLREFLLNRGSVRVRRMEALFDETSQPMVLLDFERSGRSEAVRVEDEVVARSTIDLTGNRSWRVTDDLAPLFDGPRLGDFMVASSGMTIGRNDLFLREIVDGEIVEPYDFEFFDDPITVRGELAHARFGAMSTARSNDLAGREALGATRRNVRAVPLAAPRRVTLPDADYRPYNKASAEVVYAPPAHAVFWRDDGDAVRTFKKNGPWYLHGVGGQRFFGREGITWQLVSPAMTARYLPAGFILDSGAPCAFLREGVDAEVLWFVLGWALTPLCTTVLKRVLNHTRNVQSKDFERLPFPFWVGAEARDVAVGRVKALVQRALGGERFTRESSEVRALAACYAR